MPELVVLVPGDPSTLTGGYVYNRKIAAGLVSLGWTVTMQPVDASFPSPTPSALSDARKLRALVNRHQRHDKGFGPALGPAAIQTAVKYLKDRDYRVHLENSAWHLGPEHHALQHQLLQGWTEATLELPLETGSWIKAWAHRRESYIREGRSSLSVGHADLLGWPT